MLYTDFGVTVNNIITDLWDSYSGICNNVFLVVIIVVYYHVYCESKKDINLNFK